MSLQKFLFVHQNFPGQFIHAATELVRRGHEVVAVGIQGRDIPGVRMIRYAPKATHAMSALEALKDFEAKVTRGLACALTLAQLRKEGFQPDVIVAHPGWGEALFCKDVWPRARLVLFPEFFYSSEGADYNFDPEFSTESLAHRIRLRMKNTAQLHALHAADAGYVPTRWQLSQIPAEYHPKLRVIFDGIDTQTVAPAANAYVQLRRAEVRLSAQDEVITFVNRNLEPYRGFHIFMRALPEILRRRPNAHCIIVGRDGVSYGAAPAGGGSWKDEMLREIGAGLPMERVHFVGGLSYANYLRVLQVSSCHVYLTYPFVLSWSCLEAMSAGCVVVGSRTGPVQEVIEEGKTGFLFDFFDKDALAERVCGVLAERSALGAIRERARASVVERYDLRTRCLPELLEFLLQR